jgi:Asp/Glu/Hydantoin racemase
MKRKVLGLIHTTATLVPVFQGLCRTKLPNVDVFNLADDSLIKDVIAHGELTPLTARRVAGHIRSAAEGGADFILVTCSSIVPVLRVDQPMADKAIGLGQRIGVIATLATTLEPTADLIRRRAQAAGREITLVSRLCEGAFEALMAGNNARHDAAVTAALVALAAETDVIVLAQASMARVAAGLESGKIRTPVLASPEIAIDHLAGILG